MLVENPAIARVYPGVTTGHISYENFYDNNPYNDFVVVKRNLIGNPAWVDPRISYENFYDNNPFNDYATIVETPDTVEYITRTEIETIVP